MKTKQKGFPKSSTLDFFTLPK